MGRSRCRFAGRLYALLGACFAVLACPGASAQSGSWHVLDAAPERFSGRHDDVYFASADTGWVVNTSGFAFRTYDRGESWESIVNGTLPDIGARAFRSVGFADARKGWIGSLTYGSVLFETLDGGDTWADITDRIDGDADPHGICGISVVDEHNVFGVGRFNGPAVFVKSNDGGQTWQSRSLHQVAGTLVDVHFFSADEGLAVGGTSSNLNDTRAVVLTTDDGGATWIRRHTSAGPDSEWGWKISFPTRMVGYVAVEYDSQRSPLKVLKTVDGGMNWSEIEIAGSSHRGFQGIGFVSPTLGWAGGRGRTVQTVQGGVSWQDFATIDGNVNRFRFHGDTLGYAVGRTVYKFVGDTTSGNDGMPGSRPLAIESVFPQPSNGEVTVRYRVDSSTEAYAEVFDLAGRRLARITSETDVEPGTREFRWNGRLDGGARVAPGVYVVRISSGRHTTDARIVIAAPR